MTIERVNIPLTPPAAEAIEVLCERSGRKKVDVVNQGIRLLEYFEAQTRAGHEVFVRQADGAEVLIKMFW